MSDVDVTREIAAPPEVVWDLVSDLPRMGEWSPENEGGEWVGGATGPEAGAKFRGVNRHGRRSWKTTATVSSADRPDRFEFSVSAGPLPVSAWAFEIEPAPGGSTVTQRWTDRRPGWFKMIAGVVTGVSDRAAYNRDGMVQTLDALAESAESA